MPSRRHPRWCTLSLWKQPGWMGPHRNRGMRVSPCQLQAHLDEIPLPPSSRHQTNRFYLQEDQEGWRVKSPPGKTETSPGPEARN